MKTPKPHCGRPSVAAARDHFLRCSRCHLQHKTHQKVVFFLSTTSSTNLPCSILNPRCFLLCFCFDFMSGKNGKFVNDLFMEMSEYLNKAESLFIMEEHLHKCAQRVDYSRQQWGNTHSSMNNLTKNTIAEIESIVKENIYANHIAHQEFVSASSNLDADFSARASDTLTAINDSLVVDKDNQKEMESMANLCLDELTSIKEKHGESISSIRAQAEKCLIKGYTVDQYTDNTQKKCVIEVPSLASIEDMRSLAFENLKEEKYFREQEKNMEPELLRKQDPSSGFLTYQ